MIERERNKKQDRPICTMLTTSEVARILNVHASTIRRWGEKGIIKSYRIGPRANRRFRREDTAILYLNRAIQKYLADKSA
jgi:excisionase family DNA binding protein